MWGVHNGLTDVRGRRKSYRDLSSLHISLALGESRQLPPVSVYFMFVNT